jgi:hypothetical protein
MKKSSIHMACVDPISRDLLRLHFRFASQTLAIAIAIAIARDSFLASLPARLPLSQFFPSSTMRILEY